MVGEKGCCQDSSEGGGWELDPSGQVTEGLGHSGGGEELLLRYFWGRGSELNPGGQIDEGQGHSGGEEGLLSI